MVPQRSKDFIFTAFSPPAVINHYIKKWTYRRRKHLRVNLGSGTRYLPGYANIDINPFRKSDLWLDARYGLPFAEQSVDSIYCVHTLEHFFPDEVETVLAECRRVLRTGGGIRIVVPHLGNSIRAYSRGLRDWFIDWPRNCESLGGRFSNYMFCDGQHRAGFDFEYLVEILTKAGFGKVTEACVLSSRFIPSETMILGETAEDSGRDLPRSLYVEAFR